MGQSNLSSSWRLVISLYIACHPNAMGKNIFRLTIFALGNSHRARIIAKTHCWICWRESVRRRARIFPPLSDLEFDWPACDMWPPPDLAVHLSARDRPMQMFCSPPPSNIQLGCRIFCKFFLDVALLLAVSHRYAPDSASEFLALLHSSEWRTVRGELDQLDLFGKAR